MRTVTIADMTLRTSTEARVSLSFKEKVEIAKHLSNLCVDVIELPALENLQADTLLLRTISAFAADNILSLPVGNDTESVAKAADALSKAAHPRLSVQLPLSPVQMEYMAHLKPAKMIPHIEELVSKASTLCSEVEFMAVDATRAERAFLIEAVNTAIKSGAGIITLCDSASLLLPDEYAAFITSIKKDCPALNQVKLGIECKNVNSWADSSAIFAIRAGADEVKVLSGGKSYTTIVPIAKFIENYSEKYNICSNLKMTELLRQTDMIKWINKSKRKDSTPFDETNQTDFSGLSLGKNEDISEVSKMIKTLGYDLSEDDLAKVYERYQNISKKKSDSISVKELDMIISSVALQVPATYQLKNYVINSGNIITSTAHVTLEKDGRLYEGVCLGDGPIDAAFLAIEQILGHHYELDDFQIQSVTEGRGATGSTLVKLRSNGKLYSGNGISTDIIGASIRAYINAIHKIEYEEGNK